MSHKENEQGRPLLTVIIPVFNEAETLTALVARVSSVPIEMQIVAVDDGSTDGSSGILANLAENGHLEVIVHTENRGKGAAIRTALENARGEIVVIQDADLEYNPEEFATLLRPLTNGSEATVVYGSRFMGEAHQMSRWHWFGNHLVTSVFNLLYGTNLTDMETCYKAIRREVLQNVTLESNRWGIDPEITARLVRAGNAIVEVPVRYEGRDLRAGKKLRWKDGFAVLQAIFRYRFLD